MKNAVIAALIAAIAIGGALGAFAATRTIETNANVEVGVWRRVSDGTLFLSTRPEGGNWSTSSALQMTSEGATGRYERSNLVTVTVPVEVQVEVSEPATTSPTGNPQLKPALATGTCCDIRGMNDDLEAQTNVVAAMQRIVDFANETYGFQHYGNIVINIAHSSGGLSLRYQEVLGYAPGSLPSSCSFQEGEHIFLGPHCRSDDEVLVTEWFQRAVGVPDLSPVWLSENAFGHFKNHFLTGNATQLDEHRLRSAVLFKRAGDVRLGREDASLRELVFVFAVQEYGTFGNWVQFYRHVQIGWEVEAAFKEVFGVTLPEFYSTFEEWVSEQKLILIASAYGSCTEAYLNIPPYGGGFPDYRVPLEKDLDNDGVVCEWFLGAQ